MTVATSSGPVSRVILEKRPGSRPSIDRPPTGAFHQDDRKIIRESVRYGPDPLEQLRIRGHDGSDIRILQEEEDLFRGE
jgi:hypothetical protein